MNLTDREKILLYGHDTTENIVSVEQVPDQDGKVEIFRRVNGQVLRSYDTFKYFIYVNDTDPVLNTLSQGTPYMELEGGNFYNRLILCQSYKQLSFIKKNAINSYVPIPSAQYLLHSGKTMFKGMTFDDPLRAYVDIEVITAEGYEFPNAMRPADKIVIIAFHFNHTYEDVLLVLNEDGLTKPAPNRYLFNTERELLEGFIKMIRSTNADVLCGHNFFKFDFPYIVDRCKMHSVKLALGRNGAEPNMFDTNIKFADKTEEFTNVEIYGRTVLDTYFVAKQYDVVKRELPSYGLKDIVKYLGQAKEDRTYVDGSEITNYWFNRREELLAYALDDVIETEVVAKTVGQTSFYTCQMFTVSYQQATRFGSGTMIDLWLVRDYYREGYALPTPDPKLEYEGAYTDTFQFGVTKGRLVYTDVASLYPTIRDIFHIKPPKDVLDVYDTKMKLLRRIRLDYKAIAKEEKKKGNNELANVYDSLQNLVKVAINNGSYGYMGWEFGLFNYYAGAAMITEWGRKIIKLMIEFAESKSNGSCLRVDTDGSLNILPLEYSQDEKGEMEFVKDMNDYVNEKFLILYNEWKQTTEK